MTAAGRSHVIGVASVSEDTAAARVAAGEWVPCRQCTSPGQVVYHVDDGTGGESGGDEAAAREVAAGLRVDGRPVDGAGCVGD